MAKKKVSSLIGKIFGKWEVIDTAPAKNGKPYWLCKCSKCGVEKVIAETTLTKNRPVSCNCSAEKAEAEPVEKTEEKAVEKKSVVVKATKDVQADLYAKWINVTRKCSSADPTGLYYAKGIKLCDEWKRFNSFAQWAKANGYEYGKKLARKAEKKDFTPTNCYWE